MKYNPSFRQGCRSPASRDGNIGDCAGLKSAIERWQVTVHGLDFGIPAEMTRL